MEHDELDALAVAHRLDGRRPGVARGRPDDGHRAPGVGQLPFEEPTDELERDVLERQRRPVEQLEEPSVVAEPAQRDDVGVVEARVGALDEWAQLVLVERGGHQIGEHPGGDLGVGAVAPAAQLRVGEAGQLGGHVQPAVDGETGQERVAELQDRRVTPRRDVLHSSVPITRMGEPTPMTASRSRTSSSVLCRSASRARWVMNTRCASPPRPACSIERIDTP